MTENIQKMASTEETPSLFNETIADQELRGDVDEPTTHESIESEGEGLQAEQPAESLEAIDFQTLAHEAEMFTELEADQTFRDFQILNDAEFEELLEEDPDGATRYQYKLSRFQEHQRKKAGVSAITENLIQDAVEEMVRLVPDIFGEGKEAGELVRFAQQNGMDPTFLNLISNPAARISLPGQKPLLLGRGATGLVKMLKNLYQKAPGGRTQGAQVKPRGSVASKEKAPTASPGGLTERQFAGLSAAEQDRLLREV